MGAGTESFVDEASVRMAIDRAEATTIAPITVTIANAKSKAPIRVGALRDLRRRADGDAHPGAVHFYFSLQKRAFAVVGNGAAHTRIGQRVFEEVATAIESHVRAGDATAGLVAGIEIIGTHLAHHFPRSTQP